MRNYDILVIGTGAGTKLIRPCAAQGLKVAALEKAEPGGTCLNHGCIPSKMLIHPADLLSEIRDAHRFELDVNQNVGVRFKELVGRVNDTTDKDSLAIPPIYQKIENIDYFPYEGKFIGNKTLLVNGEELTAERIFIAAGARPNIPNQIEGLAGTPFLTYKEALRLRTQPKKVIIIGGGYIAVELGHFFGALGTEVEFIVRSAFLRHEDSDIVKAFEEQFQKKYTVHCGYEPTRVDFRDGTFTVSCINHAGETISCTADALLVATGVRPNTDNLGLENTAIELDRHGFIKVNERLETTVPGVYAFGDIIGRHLFRHMANYEGDYLFQSKIISEADYPITYPPIPHAVFTSPQIAGVGKTEEQLIDEGVAYYKGLNRYEDSAMGMALRSDHGFVKLLFDRKTDKLLGAHCIGKEAATLIHMAIAYMKMNATLHDMLDTIYIHPALSELVRNAARKAKVNRG